MSDVRAFARQYDGSVKVVEPARISDIVRNPQDGIWVDIADADIDDVEMLREEFGFHPLALEDVLRRGQRPKVDQYEGYYFFVMYAAECSTERQLVTREIHAFWGGNYLVTVHQGPIPEIDHAISRWRVDAERLPQPRVQRGFRLPFRRTSARERLSSGVPFQVYALLDAIVDGYFPVLDALAERIDEIEDRVFDVDNSLVREIFAMRRELIEARRVLAPSRDVLNELLRRNVPVFPLALEPYLSDVFDHTLRAIDALDLQRDLVASAMDTYLSAASNRLNQTMRTMTALTVGLMLPTLIAGIYGMNFDEIPELHWGYGYPIALIVMVISAGALFAVFKRVGWL